MLATWRARREAQAIRIAAKGEADALLIQAEAQSEAREILLSQDTEISGELDISDAVRQRIQFQERKRQLNIESVVKKATTQLGDTEVSNDETDHDWTAHFFNHVQDVSSEEMQSLWAKVLAGEVERAGSTSIRTLGSLKNIDQSTARLFRKFCSGCVFLCIDGRSLIDARVPSLGGNAASNALKPYGLGFGELNRLNEHGIIISEGLLPLLPVTPDVDRPSTFQARFSDRAVRCARAFGLGEVGFDCCQAGWRTGIRLQLRRIGGRAVAGARPAGISRVVRRCRGSRRVGGARRCRAGCRRPLRCGGGGSSGTRTRRDSGADGRGAGHGRFRAPSASGSRTHDGSRSARDGRALHRRPWAGDRGRAGQDNRSNHR